MAVSCCTGGINVKSCTYNKNVVLRHAKRAQTTDAPVSMIFGAGTFVRFDVKRLNDDGHLNFV